MWRKIDGVDCNLLVIKDRDCATKLMSTHEKLTKESNAQDSVWHVKMVKGRRKVRWRITFKHVELFWNYYENRHLADDHNYCRHLTLSIEVTQVTTRKIVFFSLS